MSKLYMFFPKNEEDTENKDSIMKSCNGIAHARQFARELLVKHKNKYVKILITKIVVEDTVHKPFRLD